MHRHYLVVSPFNIVFKTKSNNIQLLSCAPHMAFLNTNAPLEQDHLHSTKTILNCFKDIFLSAI